MNEYPYSGQDPEKEPSSKEEQALSSVGEPLPAGEQASASGTENPEKKRTLRADCLQVGLPLLAIGFIFLFSSILQLLVATAVSALCPSLLDLPGATWALSLLPMYLVAMPLSLLLFRLVPRKELARKDMSLPTWLALLSFCFALTYLGSIIGVVLNAILGFFSGNVPTNDLQSTALESPVWVTLIFVGILAPILEEIFFRKLLVDRLAFYGDLPAILISGIAFGLVHGNFYQFFYAAAVGIVFGYIYIRTGKLRYTVGLHMAVNLVGSVYTSAMYGKIDMELLESNALLGLLRSFGGLSMMAAYYVFVIAVLVSLPFAILHLRRMIRFRRGERTLSGREWGRVLLLNPATYCFLGVCAFFFILSITA